MNAVPVLVRIGILTTTQSVKQASRKEIWTNAQSSSRDLPRPGLNRNVVSESIVDCRNACFAGGPL